MEKPTRNKALLITAIIITLGVAWIGWKYWGWFGGVGSDGFPRNPKDQDKYTKDGKVYVYRANNCAVAPCEGGTWVIFNSGDSPDGQRSFAVGGTVSQPSLERKAANPISVNKNWSYSKVDVWKKTQQGDTVKLSGGIIPAMFKKGDSIWISMKDAGEVSVIPTKQEQILDINNSQGWMIVSLYNSSKIPQWIGGIVQKI